jgi:bacteriocin-like protein
MPIEKQKPSSSSNAAPSKKPAKSSELSDDELRSISGGMASTGGTSLGTTPTCVSQIG